MPQKFYEFSVTLENEMPRQETEVHDRGHSWDCWPAISMSPYSGWYPASSVCCLGESLMSSLVFHHDIQGRDHFVYPTANERRRYNVTSSLIGWAHSQIDLWQGVPIIYLSWEYGCKECYIRCQDICNIYVHHIYPATDCHIACNVAHFCWIYMFPFCTKKTILR